MDDAPDNSERFWAHENLVNSFSFLGKNREAVEEHSQLYKWACHQNLPNKDVLQIISNLHSPGSWAAENRIDDWIQLYTEASARLEKPEVSYYSRCDFLQMGAEVLRANGRIDEALQAIEKLERINTKQDWKHFFRFWLAVRTNRLLLYWSVQSKNVGRVEKRNPTF